MQQGEPGWRFSTRLFSAGRVDAFDGVFGIGASAASTGAPTFGPSPLLILIFDLELLLLPTSKSKLVKQLGQ